MKCIKIHLVGGSTYVQKASQLDTAIEGELDGVEIGQTITLELTPCEMTETEYAKLPEFAGH